MRQLALSANLTFEGTMPQWYDDHGWIPLWHIYEIVNLTTGRRYIGLSRKVAERFKQHRWTLEGGYHAVSELQQDWDAGYLFTMRILEASTVERLAHERERFHIERCRASREGVYNVLWRGCNDA